MPPKRKANAEVAGDAASRKVKRRIVKWKPPVVAAYLEAQGVEAAVAAKIENEKISGKSLSDLTDKKLKSVGLKALGERESVLEAASYLKDPLFGKYLEWGYDKDENFAVAPENVQDALEEAGKSAEEAEALLEDAETMDEDGTFNFEEFKEIMPDPPEADSEPKRKIDLIPSDTPHPPQLLRFASVCIGSVLFLLVGILTLSKSWWFTVSELNTKGRTYGQYLFGLKMIDNRKGHGDADFWVPFIGVWLGFFVMSRLPNWFWLLILVVNIYERLARKQLLPGYPVDPLEISDKLLGIEVVYDHVENGDNGGEALPAVKDHLLGVVHSIFLSAIAALLVTLLCDGCYAEDWWGERGSIDWYEFAKMFIVSRLLVEICDFIIKAAVA